MSRFSGSYSVVRHVAARIGRGDFVAVGVVSGAGCPAQRRGGLREIAQGVVLVEGGGG